MKSVIITLSALVLFFAGILAYPVKPQSIVVPAAGGGVTSVSGTTNQIDVATGTTTPVISLDAALQFSSSAPGALTTAPFLFTGAPVTGGTGTTAVPLIYGNSGAANPSTWSTAGTFFGFNAPSGWTGNYLDYHINGGLSLFSVGGTNGNIFTAGTVTASSSISSSTQFFVTSRSVLNSSVNGVWNMTNFAQNGFTRLALGTDTTSFPALCPSSTTLQIVVAGACTTPAPATGASFQISDPGTFGSNLLYASTPCETAYGPTTLNTGAATTTTGQSCLPANSIIDSVVGRVTTTITGACTGWEFGDGTTAARFTANNTGLTSGSTSVPNSGSAWTTGIASTTTGMSQVGASAITITCAGGNPTAGAIRVIVYYHKATSPTS